MDYQPDSKEGKESSETQAAAEKLSPGGMAAMKGETKPAGEKPPAPVETPPAAPSDQKPPEPAAPPSDQTPPVPDSNRPPAWDEKAGNLKVEGGDLADMEHEFYRSNFGERGG